MTIAAAYLLAILWMAPAVDDRVNASATPAFGAPRWAAVEDKARHAADAVPPIVPLPQEYEGLEGALHLSSLRSIVLGRGATDGDRFAAELIREELRQVAVDVSIDYEGPETSDSAAIVIRPAKGTREEGYRLSVTGEGVQIEGSHERGRFYGVMSWIQLVRAEAPDVRALRIVDFPDLALRGIVDDVSLQLPTLQEFRRVVRHLGEHKMNAYALPVESVFRFEADRTAGMGSVSPEEFAELQALAASYHVEIIPIFRTLGHFHRLFRLPEFSGLAEYPGAGTPNVQDSASYEFIGTLLDEIVPVFRSRYVHVGGATSSELGVGASAEAVEAEGAAAVHLRHYRRVYEMVRDRGKDVMMQADLVGRAPPPGQAALNDSDLTIPDDAILLDVQGSGSFPRRSLYASEGRTVVAGPLLRPDRRIFPDHAATRDNLSRALRQAHAWDAHGSLAGTWTAEGAPVLRALHGREIAYAAEYAWNPDSGATELDRRVDLQFFGIDLSDVRRLEASVRRITAGLMHPELWHHPLRRASSAEGRRPGQEPDGLSPLSLRRSAAEQLLADIEDVQRRVSRHAEWLDHYAFAVRLTSWFADTHRLASWLRTNRIDAIESTAVFDRGSDWARRLAGETRSLAQAYRLLWLRANREIYLDLVMQEFEYQIAYLEEIAMAMADEVLDVQAAAPSRFITSRGGGDESYMRTTFTLERGHVANAYLQGAGRNDVEIWLNGHRVGRTIGPVWTGVEVWNVAPRLRSGKNVIAVRALRRGDVAAEPSLANVYLEIHFMDGRKRYVTSDRTWKAVGREDGGWNGVSYSDSDWPFAVTAPAAPILTVPMFDRGLPSRIEAEAGPGM